MDDRIAENIAETGFDPRIEGPPKHMEKQESEKKENAVSAEKQKQRVHA